MHTLFRRFLLLCLMLALPLQGLAATTLLSCALAQGDAQVADGAASPCHTESQPDASPAHHDCAHCAICLHASALPIPVVPPLPEAGFAHAYASVSAGSFAGHVPDGPERPPRPALA